MTLDSPVILNYPDPKLVEANSPLERYDEEAALRVRQMFACMYEVEGVGLAAPQIGWNVQLFVVNFTGDPADERVFWNPKIGLSGDPETDLEGCLSFASIMVDVPRFPEVCLEAQTPEGPIKEVFQGKEARGIQHEYDHIKGKLFIGRMDGRERAYLLKEFSRMGYRV